MTLIEILAAVALLAVGLAFATAPLQRMSARIDVDIARENIMSALETAQRSAVRANVPVRVYLSDNASNNRLVAGFSRHRGSIDFYQLPNYVLPEHVTVSLSEGMSVIEYLSGGRVGKNGVITLSSKLNPEYVVSIQVDDGLILPAPGSPQGRHALR